MNQHEERYGACAPDVRLDVHGGITYADACHGEICHVPEPGEPEPWWFGFDCAHSFDYSPKHEAAMAEMAKFDSFLARPVFGEPSREYRTVDYVKREVAKLAGQLKALAP